MIIAIACLWGFLNEVASSGDYFLFWRAVIATQAMQALSIFTTSLLYITPFLKSFRGGFTRFDNALGLEQDEELALK